MLNHSPKYAKASNWIQPSQVGQWSPPRVQPHIGDVQKLLWMCHGSPASETAKGERICPQRLITSFATARRLKKQSTS